MDNRLAPARTIADTVLYEGYVLYPYRVSAGKNRFRWQWGVVGPSGAHADGVGEEPTMHTDLLLTAPGAALVDVRCRFLHVVERTIEPVDGGPPVERLTVGEQDYVSFDEAVERHVDLPGLDVATLLQRAESVTVTFDGDEQAEAVPGDRGHRIVRRRVPIQARVEVSAEPAPVDGVVVVRVRVENTTGWEGGDREAASRRSLVGTHVMASCTGAFLSVLEPPVWAAAAVGCCQPHRLWPVLVGGRHAGPLVLASPVILYDAPEVAPESPGEFYDGTEIDELLTLRVMAMTPEEKAEARATDPRAAAVIDRCDAAGPDDLARLHGARRAMAGPAGNGADGSDGVAVGGVRVANGDRVRLRPGRRADAHDLFYEGRTATVATVARDVDGAVHVAVTVDDDPAADLYRSTGRFLYFAPDEIEPVTPGTGGGE